MTDAVPTSLPDPPLPADVDLRDFQFMPLDVKTLRDSDLAAEETPEACWAAVLLWCASWHQVPAASLPNKEATLSKLAGYGIVVSEWNRVRAGALRGWQLCSDGRLYHSVVAKKALEAWHSKLQHAYDRECDRLRKAAKRNHQQIQVPTLEQWVQSRVSAGNTRLSAGQNRTRNSDSDNSQVIHRPSEPKNNEKHASAGNSSMSAGKTCLSAGQVDRSAGNKALSDGIPPENALKGQGQGDLRDKNPQPPRRGLTRAVAPLGRRPREIRDRSRRAWFALLPAIDHVRNNTGPALGWGYVAQTLADPIAHQVAERIGYRVIAERSQFTKGDLMRRFRELYEQLLEHGASSPPKQTPYAPAKDPEGADR